MWIRLPEVHPIPRQRGVLDPLMLAALALASPIRSQVCTKIRRIVKKTILT